jgi:hypothetical protein
MMYRRGRDDEIRLRERVAAFASLVYEQSPLQHDVLGNLAIDGEVAEWRVLEELYERLCVLVRPSSLA